MSLNALFRFNDVYTTAVSIAPVPDMNLYDTIYQERYMNLPTTNAFGYRVGSPIHFAKHLKSTQHLLVVHGTGDDNCHYQGTERLINELILHNKPFDMVAYPNRSHSISEGFNTTRHLFEHITRYFQTHKFIS
jgi:dipeptidyl-peptidase-4